MAKLPWPRLSLAANVLFLALAVAFGARRLLRPAPVDSGRLYAEERRSIFAALPLREGATVFAGDSLTDRGEWAELLGDPAVQNRGIAGETTRGMLARTGDLAALRPARLVVMIGVNDLFEGEPVSAIVPRYLAIVDALRKGAPGAKLYCQSLLPVREDLLKRPGVNASAVALNEALARSVGEHGCTYLDVRSALADAQGQLEARFTIDGVHLTGEGYAAWARALEPALLPR